LDGGGSRRNKPAAATISGKPSCPTGGAAGPTPAKKLVEALIKAFVYLLNVLLRWLGVSWRHEE
jgi:hypothetical protein